MSESLGELLWSEIEELKRINAMTEYMAQGGTMPVNEQIKEAALGVLREVHDLIRDRERWTHGAMARDAAWNNVAPWSDQATRWCAVGAIHHVCRKRATGVRVQNYAEWVLGRMLGMNIIAANDGLDGHLVVMAALHKLQQPERDRLFKRSEAGFKGWETRRRNMAMKAGMVIEQPTVIEQPASDIGATSKDVALV